MKTKSVFEHHYRNTAMVNGNEQSFKTILINAQYFHRLIFNTDADTSIAYQDMSITYHAIDFNRKVCFFKI